MLAILPGATLNASILQPDTSVVQASVKAAGVDYSGQNLSGRDFAWNDFTGANFTGTNLSGTNLQGAGLRNANLTNANLTNAGLVNTDLTGATLTGVTFTNARFNTGTIWPAGFNPLTKGMWGPGVDYSGQNLSGRDFAWNDFTGANFTNANLSGAHLRGTSFRNANLTNANITNTELRDADLTGATLTGASLTGARFTVGTVWPTRFNPLNKGMWGPGVDYSGQNLAGKDFYYYDFAGANFTNANLNGAHLRGTSFRNANLTNANITNAELRDADLTGARYSQFTTWPSGFDPVAAGAVLVVVAEIDITKTGGVIVVTGSTGTATAYRSAFDTAGNFIVTGSFTGTVDFDPGSSAMALSSAGGNDGFVAKYSPQRTLLWARRFGGTGNDAVNAVAVSSKDAVYFGGRFESTAGFDAAVSSRSLATAGGPDGFVGSFDANGGLTWIDGYGAGQYDEINSLAIQPDGNVVVAGSFDSAVDFDRGPGSQTLSADNLNDVFILNLTTTGDFRWVRQFIGSGYQYPRDAAVGSDGSIAITGSFYGTVDFDPGPGQTALTATQGLTSAFIVKLNADGALVWAGNLGGSMQFGESITVDSAGAVFASGVATGTTDFAFGPTVASKSFSGSRFYLAKYDTAGAHQWARTFGKSDSIYGSFLGGRPLGGVAVDLAGRVYSAGGFNGAVDFDDTAITRSASASGIQDAYLLQWSAATGELQAVTTYGGSGSDRADGIALSPFGQMLVAGTFASTISFASGLSAFSLGGSSAFVAILGNQSPVEISLSSASLAENQPAGTTVGTLSTIDPDTNATFTYSLVPGAGSTGNTFFTVVGNQLKTADSLNHDVNPVLSIRIRSSDQFGAFIEKALTITVTNVNEAPTDIALSASSIAENAGANAVVGTLSTPDPDAGNTFTYTLITGTGSTDNAAFNISGNQLRATASLNFETKSSYSVRVRSTDQGGLFTEKTFTITVTNVNETPSDIALSASSITENAGANAVVGTLSTTDPDAANTFTYTLVTGTGSTDNAAFNISGNQLRATASLNFETKSSYTVRIRSTDQGGLFTEKAFTITVTNVNETPSDIALSASSITENAGANAVVGTLSTTDPDASNTFTYTLVTGTGSTDNAAFNISGNQLRATASLNFETKSSYSVRVRSTDQGGLFTEKTFTITVTNENDAPTYVVFSRSSLNVPESLRPTISLPMASITVTDDSVGANTLSLSGDDAALFSVSNSQLWLRPGIDFDYGVKNRYSVVVTAQDASLPGNTPVSTTFTLVIENEPTYHGREYVEPSLGETVTDTDTRSGVVQLIKRGAGKVVLTGSNTHSGGTTVEVGEVVVRNTGALGSGRLTVKAGATVQLDVHAGNVTFGALTIEPGGRLDLGYGRITVQQEGYNLTAVRQLLLGGFVSEWVGQSGLRSRNVADVPGGSVGYLVNNDGSITVGFTARGDTNLDGIVDVLDISNFLAADKFDTSASSGWIDGDFNYDGIVDILDVTGLINTGLVDAGPYIPAASTSVASAASAATPTSLSATETAFMAFAIEQTTAGTTTTKKLRFGKA